VHVPCALQLHLSWIPGDYPGYEQWYYKCRPTCVFRVRPLPCCLTHPTYRSACTDRPAACSLPFTDGVLAWSGIALTHSKGWWCGGVGFCGHRIWTPMRDASAASGCAAVPTVWIRTRITSACLTDLGRSCNACPPLPVRAHLQPKVLPEAQAHIVALCCRGG
jgi:hypothetical protein